MKFWRKFENMSEKLKNFERISSRKVYGSCLNFIQKDLEKLKNFETRSEVFDQFFKTCSRVLKILSKYYSKYRENLN